MPQRRISLVLLVAIVTGALWLWWAEVTGHPAASTPEAGREARADPASLKADVTEPTTTTPERDLAARSAAT